MDEIAAPDCEHLTAVFQLAARQTAAIRYGRTLAATAAYNLAAETMDTCRAECGDASPYRDAEPMRRYVPDPPRRGFAGLCDRMLGVR